MANKVGEDFYRKLSRKELQSLCKKYGLPARKSSYEMAESLRSYFLRRDLSVSSFGKSFNKIQDAPPSTSSLQLLQPVAPLNLPEKATDGFVPRLYIRDEHGKGSISTNCDEVQSCVHEACCKASLSQFLPQCDGRGFDNFEQPGRVDQEDASQIHCSHINVAAYPKESAPFSIKTSSQPPASFEFYVSSEEGINLCVDLNSNPSDWINKFRNQVHLCENVSHTKSQNLHQELGRIGDNNKQMKRSFVQGGGSQCLMPLPTVSCNADEDVSECFLENHLLISSNPNSDVQNHIISDTQSRIQNGYAASGHSDITNVPLEKTACNFAVNYISDGSANLVALEHQSSKHHDEVCENSTLQNNYSLENTSMRYPGYLASHSIVGKLSEAKTYHEDSSDKPNRNSEFLELVHLKTTEGSESETLGNSRENDSFQTCSEEQDWNNIGNGRESSVCSHVENSYDRTCSVPGSVQLNPELHRKRLQMDNECQYCSSDRDSKLLRSTKHSAGELLPRRSTRLVSK